MQKSPRIFLTVAGRMEEGESVVHLSGMIAHGIRQAEES